MLKNNPVLATKIISLAAQGQTQQVIADELDISQPTVQRIQKANQSLIQKEAQKYLDMLPDIVNNDVREIKDYFTISKDLSEALKNGSTGDSQPLQRFCDFVNTKITDIKRSIGMYSAHSPGLVFQQLNIFNTVQTSLNPQILQLFQGVSAQSQLDYDNIIDAEVLSS